MSDQLTISILKWASIGLVIFGIAIAAAAVPSMAWLMTQFIDLAFWPFDGAQTLSAAETRFLCAICGGVLTGWGVVLYQVTTRILVKEPELAKSIILWSAGSWFVVDSLGSIASGAPMNALYNLAFLALFVVPLMMRQASSAEAAS